MVDVIKQKICSPRRTGLWSGIMPLQQIYPSGYCCVVTVKNVFNIPELLTRFSTSEGCRTKGQILEGE